LETADLSEIKCDVLLLNELVISMPLPERGSETKSDSVSSVYCVSSSDPQEVLIRDVSDVKASPSDGDPSRDRTEGSEIESDRQGGEKS
jgi:hypothetical protein